MKKVAVLNSLVSVGSYRDFINQIFFLVDNRIPSYVCFANVHMVMEGYHDRAFQKVINKANIIAPDGKPISLFSRLFNGLKQERVCGMDLFPDILKEAEALGKSVYFYGTTPELLTAIEQKVKKEFPKLNVCGSYSPPFRELTTDENKQVIANITMASPHLVFVSLGCPKQEKWMAENKHKIGACLLGVGQAFKVFAGVEKRLPTWMRNLSLEWIYRLYLEPERLWKRYLVTNTFFLFLVLNHTITHFFNKFWVIFLKERSPQPMFSESDE